MASLREVAKLAGVSVSTVSYVLNGKKKVKEETYQKIMDAVKESGYSPNQAARSLRTKETKSVAVLVADFRSAFCIDVLSGIESTLVQEGYSVILSNSRMNSEVERENIKDALRRDVEGIIVLGTGATISQPSYAVSIPIIYVDRVSESQQYTVSVDNEEGGYIGTKYLLRQGCRHIAFMGIKDAAAIKYRIDGYQRAVDEFGIIDHSSMLLSAQSQVTPESGYQAAMQLFQKHGEMIDGIFAASDNMAVGVLRALYELNYRVPGEIKVMGFDDISISRYAVPSLTTVAQPGIEMGESAARMLLNVLRGVETEKRIILTPRLVIRESA